MTLQGRFLPLTRLTWYIFSSQPTLQQSPHPSHALHLLHCHLCSSEQTRSSTQNTPFPHIPPSWSQRHCPWASAPGRCVSTTTTPTSLTDQMQLICAVLVTAFMGNNIARAWAGTHSIINYSLFVGVWWMFTLLYFLPTSFIDKFSIPIVDIALDALSVIFGFCAAVALPAYIGAHSCSNSVSSLHVHIHQHFHLTSHSSVTHTPTASSTALQTRSKTAARHRLPLPSCGSAGLLSSPPSSSTL